MINIEKSTRAYFGDDLASEVFLKKYSLEKLETPEDMHQRLARRFAEVDRKHFRELSIEELSNLSAYGRTKYEVEKMYPDYEGHYYELFKNFGYLIPQGSVMAGAGTGKAVSLSNCFFNGHMQDDINSIWDTTKSMAQVGKRRGGTSTDLSYLRPRGSGINNSATTSTGATSWLELIDITGKLIGQEGRKMAMMVSMDIRHPDVEEFITVKNDLSKVTNANLSVKIDQEFLNAVNNDEDFILRWPCHKNIDKDYSVGDYGTLIKEDDGSYTKRIKAKELWNTIIESAWKVAEPGLLLWDNIIDFDPTSVYSKLKPMGVNPCQPAWATVLTPDGIKSFADIEIGSTIWSSEGWTKVINKMYSGVKEVFKYQTTRGKFEGTEQHRVLQNGVKVEVGEAKGIDTLNTPEEDLPNITSKIVSVESQGYHDVYDITVDNPSHTYWSGGHDVSNCAELPLGDFDSCRLLAVNLLSLVKFPFTKDACLDKELAYKIFYEAQVAADAIVDLELDSIDRILIKIGSESKDALEERDLWLNIKKIAESGRRTGTGVTAYGDFLAAQNLPYADVKATEEIFNIMAEATLTASIDLAIRRGAFPLHDTKLEYDVKSNITPIGLNGYYQRIVELFPEQARRMIKFGRRNSGLSTIAPTGSLSILTGTTSGVEPLFMATHIRRKKVDIGETPDFTDENGIGYKEFLVVHKPFEKWIQNKYPSLDISTYSNEDLDREFVLSPWYKQTANDIDWKQRVDIQGVIQKYITSSISSTINLPETVSKDIVGELYIRAHSNGLKGLTVYRDGSRSGVLIDSNKSTDKPLTDFSTVHAPKRPKKLEADLHTLKVKGQPYIAIVGLYEGKPYEIFSFKLAGEKITDNSGIIKKVAKSHYSYISDEVVIGNLIESNSNTLEKACTLQGSMLLRHRAPLKSIIKTLRKIDPTINSFVSGLNRVLSKYDTVKEELVCSKCGGLVIKEAGCEVCTSCGDSKCE